MIRKLILMICSLLLCITTVSASAANNDHILAVYVCGANSVLIQTQNNGWVFAWATDIGSDQVDAIATVALSLMTTGQHTGYFNPSSSRNLVCGVQDVAEITVLRATYTPPNNCNGGGC